MILLTAIVIGVLFGAGMHALAHRDLIRLAGGTLLIGNSAVLFLVSAALEGRTTPILPVGAPEQVADPLVQALALTAIVISFATTVLLLRVVMAIEETHETLILDDIAGAEEAYEADEENKSRREILATDSGGSG